MALSPKQLARDENLAALVAEYEPALKRFFMRRLSGHHEVEDLVQDVFTRLSRLDNLEAIENPQAFIFHIAQNLLRDRGRKFKNRHIMAHVQFDDAQHSVEAFSAERVFIGRQSIEQVRQTILELPKRTGEVFLLSRFDGLTYREISRTLRISVSAVEKHMMTALAALNREVDRE